MVDRPVTYAVDFDGTLCENAYPSIGSPNRQLIEKLIGERIKGNIVILWTCRCGTMLEEAIAFCRSYGLEFDYVNENSDGAIRRFGEDPRKIFADVYIDDKAYKPKVSDGTKVSKKTKVVQKHAPASCIIF